MHYTLTGTRPAHRALGRDGIEMGADGFVAMVCIEIDEIDVAIIESVLAPLRGLSLRQAAEKLGVSTATAHRWLRAH
jgi:hypothetical protein